MKTFNEHALNQVRDWLRYHSIILHEYEVTINQSKDTTKLTLIFESNEKMPVFKNDKNKK